MVSNSLDSGFECMSFDKTNHGFSTHQMSVGEKGQGGGASLPSLKVFRLEMMNYPDVSHQDDSLIANDSKGNDVSL